MRDFAVAELKLPDNASYRRYADLQRGAAVWNVVAAPELSLALKTWCFPVRWAASATAAISTAPRPTRWPPNLRGQGFEVNVYGVPAYSTLGFSNWVGGDPLLNTFIDWPDADLAQLIFHELAHQVAYAADDTTFNESFATAVERIGGARWLALHATPAQREQHARAQRQRDDFRALTLRWRGALAALYASPADDAAKRSRKTELMAAMRAEHAGLKQSAGTATPATTAGSPARTTRRSACCRRTTNSCRSSSACSTAAAATSAASTARCRRWRRCRATRGGRSLPPRRQTSQR